MNPNEKEEKQGRIELGFYIFFMLFVVVFCILMVFIGKYDECRMVKDAYERTVVEVVKECKRP